MSERKREEKRRKEAFSKEFDRLAKLYKENRFAFEIERKKIIDHEIDSLPCSEKQREKRREEQKNIDRMMKHAGSVENRMSLIQSIFWHHMVNNWQPAIQEYNRNLTLINKKLRSLTDQPPHLYVKKSNNK